MAKSTPSQILLGYESGTGAPVHIPLHHLVVTGTTQLSGKTTTLEGLISRSGMTSIAFRTKRGEASFRLPDVHRHEPYFRERADWQYVQGLLEATMRERMRFERSWIIDAAKGARTLRDVLGNVVSELETARGLSKSVLTTLKAYLEIVVPEIDAIRFARALDLKPGLNVMDLVGLRDEVQSLVIASTLEALHESATGVIVVIPEAWKFVPEGRGTPVKYPLEAIARQGAGIGVYIFLDSQDITGVDKTILKNVDTWLIGRQREKNEVERAIAQLPLPKGQRPKPEEVMRLRIGHFLVATRNDVRTVYVKPAWLPDDVAAAVARSGDVDAARALAPEPEDDQEDDVTIKEELAESRRENDELRARIRALEEQLAGDGKPAKEAPRGTGTVDVVVTEPEKFAAGIAERVRHELDVDVTTPVLRVRERVVTVAATSEDARGRVAILFADGFFDDVKQVPAVIKEFSARGWGEWTGGAGWNRMNRILLEMAEMGFLRHEGKTYIAVEDAKERVERVKERERA